MKKQKKSGLVEVITIGKSNFCIERKSKNSYNVYRFIRGRWTLLGIEMELPMTYQFIVFELAPCTQMISASDLLNQKLK